MNLYKRPDGSSPYWFFDLVDPKTGKRVRRSTKETNKGKALLAAQAYTQRGNDTTLGEALDAYVQALRADGKPSWVDARNRFDKTLGRGNDKLTGAERWGKRFKLDEGMPLADLGPTDLQALKVARQREQNAPGTIAAELRMLRAACKHAEDLGFRPAGIRKWGVPKTTAKLRHLAYDEAKAAMDLLHPDTPVKAGRHGKLVVPGGVTREQRQDAYDLFLALVLTGGRWAEVGKLTWKQFDLESQVIKLYGFKSERERTVPLPPEIAEMLVRRSALKRGPYVFPGKGGKARSGPSRAITRAMDKAGLNEDAVVEAFGRATIHTLRHTYASWLRQRGLGLDEIQPLLGHADLKTTQIYAAVVDAETFARARDALAKSTARL